MVAIDRASSGRPSIDIGMPPRPTAATLRDPIRRVGSAVVVLMPQCRSAVRAHAWATGARGYDSGVTVSADLEGRVYPATAPYLVGREKVREFARAVGSPDPLSLDVGRPRPPDSPTSSRRRPSPSSCRS